MANEPLQKIQQENIKDVSDSQQSIILTGNYSKVKRQLASASQSLQSFVDFLKPLRPLIGWGLSLGILFAAGGDLLTKTLPESKDFTTLIYWQAFFFLIIKEIGVGLIVAAVAVFGYEYSQHIRGDFERQIKQDAALESLDDATKLLQTTAETKSFIETIKDDLTTIRSKDIARAGERILNLSIGNSPDEEKFKELVKKIVQQAATLKQTGTVYCQSYLSFINWLCEHIILSNLTQLSHLEEHADNSAEATQWRFDLPINKSVAGQMLGFQLNSLERDDLYQTVSNVLFWEGKDFDFFWRETIKACAEGIRNERLFNLCSLIEDENLLNEKFSRAKEIVEKHKKLEGSDKEMYEVRFFTVKQAEKAFAEHKGTPEATVAELKMGTMTLTSFGVFTHRADPSDDVVSFRVENEQLSRMSVSRIAKDVDKYVTRFKLMWAASENVPNPFEKDVEYFKKVVQQEWT